MHEFVLALLFLSDLASYRQGASLVDAAIVARGKELAPVAFRMDATVLQLHQSPRPSAPFLETRLEQTIAADPAARAFVIEETSTWPNFTARTTVRISGQELTTIRHGSGTHSVSSDGTDATVARIARRHPDLLLEAAGRQRASLRRAGADKVHVVLDDGSVTTVTFRAARLVTAEWIEYHDVFGDVAHRIDYQWSGGEPIGFRQFENERLAMTGRYDDTKRGDTVAIPQIAVPVASKLASTPSAEPPRIEELAPGVFLVRNAGGPDYHSLVVRFRDRLVVVEAPRSPQRARTAIAAIKGWDAQRPIEEVAVTHHHDDHLGGIRGYAEAGARIVTTEGNVSLIEALLGAPHTIRPAARVAAQVIGIRSARKIADDTNELIFLNPGPNDHVSESLIAWLPRQQIVFQGDLFRYDPGRPEAARQSAVAFADFIARQNLPVKTIVGVHGEPASMDDLRQAIAMRDASR
ncbi:MAG TPA: hypothetical protein VF432_04015 [Thermoanaerobaculia bacterium]